MKNSFLIAIAILTFLSDLVFASPFFSQRVPNPRSEDGSLSSSTIYNFFGRTVVQRCADNFRISSSKVVRSVSWWGKFKNNKAPKSIEFDVKIYGDKNGRPDNNKVLSSTNISFTQLTDTGQNFGGKSTGDDIYVFRANIAPVPIEAEKQFWFSVLGDSGEGNGSFGWRFIIDNRDISVSNVQDLNGDISGMNFDWKEQAFNNFSFVLDDKFISGLPLPDLVSEIPEIETFNKLNNLFSITFKTQKALLYNIETSSDLKKWSTSRQIRGTGNTVQFTDEREAIFKNQYFRVKLSE